MSYFDLAIIVIVALFALIGLWKGFFKTLISFCGWFFAFLIAFFITKPIAGALLDVAGVRSFVIGTGKGWSMYQWIYGKLPPMENATGILEVILHPFIKIASNVGGDLRQNVALLLANGVFSIVVFFGLLIVLRLLLLLFTMFANAMTKGKLAGALNRLLGLVMGAVRGLGLIAIVMVLMTFLMGMSFMSPVRAQLDDSVLAQPMYNQVSRITNKFINGGDATLRKLLKFIDQDEEEEEPAPDDPSVGVYYGVTREGEESEFAYTLEFKADGTCVLTVMVGAEVYDTRNGTYFIDGEDLTLNLTDPDETDSGIYNADGWVYVNGLDMQFAKEGVTPPPIVVYGPLEGTFTLTDDSGTYTFTFNGDTNQFTFSGTDAEGTPVSQAGVYDSDEGSVTLTYDNGQEITGTYTDTSVTIDGKTYTRQNASQPDNGDAEANPPAPDEEVTR